MVIAKYNISFGYTSNAGTLKNLKTDKYHTLISADVLVSGSYVFKAADPIATIHGLKHCK